MPVLPPVRRPHLQALRTASRLDREKRFSIESPHASDPSPRPWFQRVARCASSPPDGTARRPFAEGEEGPAAPRPIRVVSGLPALLPDVSSSHAHPRAAASRSPNRRPLRIPLRAVRDFHWLQDRQGPIRGSPLHPVNGPPIDTAPIERSVCEKPSSRQALPPAAGSKTLSRVNPRSGSAFLGQEENDAEKHD